jgi:predicted secreted hydrolase
MRINSIIVIIIIHLGFVFSAAAQDATPWDYPKDNYAFNFPKDDGSHPHFKLEWWYITGHLIDDTRNTYGFQATFFRIAGSPDYAETNQYFGHSQLYLAHMALTDITGNRFINEERLNRNGWAAYAKEENLSLKNGSWCLDQSKLNLTTFNLIGSISNEVSFQMNLSTTKPMVIFGTNGVSHKGSSSTAASYYLTYSRLQTTGYLDYKGKHLKITGQAWMDHEISSSQLSSELVGWDWTCVQFNNSEYELMLYRLRKGDGTSDPHSMLQWVDKHGKPISEPFKWTVINYWHSEKSNTTYPSNICLETIDPRTNKWIKLYLSPKIKEQELITHLGGDIYWEGACSVKDDKNIDIADSYLELTGYHTALKL